MAFTIDLEDEIYGCYLLIPQTRACILGKVLSIWSSINPGCYDRGWCKSG